MSAAGLPRWLARALVVIGWLLTPLWAWGASFLGLWAGAHLAGRFTRPLAMLAPALLGAVLFGFITLWAWVRFMRRVPHLLSHHMAERPSVERILIVALGAAGAACGARPLAAQRDASLLYGRWTPGGITSYEARLDRPLGSWLRHGPILHVLLEDRAAGRGFYGVGYEVTSPRGGSGVAMYGLLGAALGMISDTGGQGLGALWSAGVGVEWRPLRFLGLNLEERYRVTDRGPHGFWHPGAPHKGWGTLLGLSFTLESGARRRPQPVSSGGAVPAPPAGRGDGGGRPADPPLMIVGRAGDVVQTALEVLGSPYQWGGTAENGFDCSGLVQYAYARHGIRLPRTSRAQAQAGTPVAVDFDSLQAGDILTFAARPGGGVTHVGMYVGDGKFIHSSSTGVKLSRLSSADPEGAYWIPRWVGVRRVLP